MRRQMLLLVGIVLMSVPRMAWAENASLTALQQEVRALRQLVERLEARVGRLEGEAPAGAAAESHKPEAPQQAAPAAGAVAASAGPAAVPQAAPPPAPQAPPHALAAGGPTSGAAPPPAEAAPPATKSPEQVAQEHWQRLERGMTTQQVETLLGRPSQTIDASPRIIWYYVYPSAGNGSVVFTQDGSVIDWRAPPAYRPWWW